MSDGVLGRDLPLKGDHVDTKADGPTQKSVVCANGQEERFSITREVDCGLWTVDFRHSLY